MEIMLQLGSYQFGLETAAYQELTRSSEYRWPAQELFGQLPALQFTGPGAETITLPGVIYPEWRGGLGQLDAMRALAAEGKPQDLVDGEGASLGSWVIERVEETQTIFGLAGKPRKVEFNLSLRRAPDEQADGAGASPIAGNSLGGGLASAAGLDTGAVARTLPLATSVAGSSQSLGGTLARVASQVQTVVIPATQLGGTVLGAVQRAAQAVTSLGDAANQALGALNANPLEAIALAGAQNIVTRAQGLIIQADSAVALLNNTSAALTAQGAGPAVARVMVDASVAANQALSLARNTAAQAAAIGA